ncbi:hypothetical protein E2C01_016042 [Portunus trituberculatus]|uniref:Uncharacterized protein n=1 Tax=Portunus trituberculatus TaxID=210409 RepID=A0A5B7DPH5_PORTR|nr:hypothetical protein [Portunus trituberculatus]
MITAVTGVSQRWPGKAQRWRPGQQTCMQHKEHRQAGPPLSTQRGGGSYWAGIPTETCARAISTPSPPKVFIKRGRQVTSSFKMQDEAPHGIIDIPGRHARTPPLLRSTEKPTLLEIGSLTEMYPPASAWV